MTSTPRIGILAGTVREGRNSIKIADWAQRTLAAAGIDATFEVIDLAAQELGKFTSATPPRMHQGAYEEPELAAWSEKIAGFDGFIFATGEYNGSVPGVMKNAVDSLFVEWTEKPVGFIGWGSTGASSALEHWHTVITFLGMKLTGEDLKLPFAEVFPDFQFTPGDAQNAAVVELGKAVAAAA
ncbi:MAG TPA: NADPH-dependent oxidoreductase [Corynebacterium variabile]|uniref:NADPH-dependent FMN reductase n=1 Tax=Corynebacterium variabile TaxID=1727 RepID=UPI000EDFDB43|nr:NAD(P)H-dependent oxidoreductase [Corynebacterium variabile]HAJ52430.1 NADPH-dependent oxidoreductase [Corynebacterium variabile]